MQVQNVKTIVESCLQLFCYIKRFLIYLMIQQLHSKYLQEITKMQAYKKVLSRILKIAILILAPNAKQLKCLLTVEEINSIIFIQEMVGSNGKENECY